MLYPSRYDVVVDDPGRVQMRDQISIDPSTRRLSFKPRTEWGDALTAFGLSAGCLTVVIGSFIGALRQVTCGTCGARGYLSVWPIWGAGFVLIGAGGLSAYANEATLRATP